MALWYETKMTWKSDKFDQAIRNKQHYQWRFGDRTLDLNWDSMVHLIDTHPPRKTMGNVEKNNFQLQNFHQRPSAPKLLRNMIAQLEKKFYKNNISLIAFGSIGISAQSFDIHRDVMDVIYMQGLGNVDFSIWEAHKEGLPSNLEHGGRDGVSSILRKKFKKYDICWIPRGTYHLIKPINTRVGFSFGIEGNVDPCTYI